MDGLHPTLGLTVFLVAVSSLLPPCTAVDRLVAGRPLSVNQTIVSASGNYVLRFFSPGRSEDRRHYVGISYNNTAEKRVVWVVNKEKPVLDSGGVITVARDGNLVVQDGKGGLIWSSNVSELHGNTTAVLLDTGNLVLRGPGDVVYWQSFDHPGDTLLPEAKVRLDFRTGDATRLVSWRGPEDPSPGNFSLGFDPGIDGHTSLQMKVWRGSETWTRWRLWNGNLVYADRRNISNTSAVFVRTLEVSEEQINMSFTVTMDSPMLLFVLDPDGTLKLLLWQQGSPNWSLLGSNPGSPCDYYNSCGPSGLCNSTGTSLECSCLRGFVPKDPKGWNQRNFSQGCIRREPLKCDREDKFLTLEKIGFPDRFMSIRDVDAAECEAECLRRCNCTAYCYSDLPSAGSSTKCLVWAGELLDLRGDTRVVYALHVRVVASVLEDGLKTSRSSKKKARVLAIALATTGAVIILLGISCFFLRAKFRRKADKRRKTDSDSFGDINFRSTLPNGEHIETPLLHFSTVQGATDNFSPENKLGEGGFGPVYKGVFNDGQEIAVKRLSKRSSQGLEEFKTEILLIARLQHRNLVRLLGCSIKGEERMLIYEYLPNKSLDFFLFDPEGAVQLDWTRRFHIIEGIAQGLLYLHKHSRLRIIHRDLKASNILLDNEMNPKISDFGMARIFCADESEANTERVVGTYGYMAPEYAMKGLFSVKSDVFSFGVLLLEIITGKRNTHKFSGSLDLLGHAWRMWKEGTELELVDPLIRNSCPEVEVSRCIHVALMCIQDEAIDRPVTSDLVAMLGNENASVLVLKQPAFLIGRNMAEGDSDTLLPSSCSVNLVTISAAHGR